MQRAVFITLGSSQNHTDGRPHIPIGVEIRQESYSWSFDYAKDFILMDFQITNVSVRTAVACPDCEATGAAPGTSAAPCPDCGGTGEVRVVRQTVLGQMMSASVCRRCAGQGEYLPSPCPNCDLSFADWIAWL